MSVAVIAAPSRLATLRMFVELVKPRIMVMALLTAAGAMSMAPGRPDVGVALWLLAGTALIVGAANTLNMYIERDIDCMMTRTKNRPLPTQRMLPAVALAYGLTLGAASLPVLAHVNLLTAGLGVIALFSYVLVYTPLKQKTHWATWIGALPGALPVLMGWTAATNHIDIRGIAVFGILFIWQIPHFHAIALYRQREYDKAGLKTLPGSRGLGAARREIAIYMVVQVAVSLTLYPLGVAGITYEIIAAALGLMVLVQCFAGIIKGTDVKWARNVFIASIVYLPILFFAMVINGQV
jgi:heme o synthase